MIIVIIIIIIYALCTSLPHLVCIQKAFKMTNIIIYVKPIRMHVRRYKLTKICVTAISRSLWRTNCKSARGKKSVSDWIQLASA